MREGGGLDAIDGQAAHHGRLQHGHHLAALDAQDSQLLGAAILGIEGGEVMSVLQTAMMGSLPVDRIQAAPFAHPTLAESLNNLFAGLDLGPSGGRPRCYEPEGEDQ